MLTSVGCALVAPILPAETSEDASSQTALAASMAAAGVVPSGVARTAQAMASWHPVDVDDTIRIRAEGIGMSREKGEKLALTGKRATLELGQDHR